MEKKQNLPAAELMNKKIDFLLHTNRELRNELETVRAENARLKAEIERMSVRKAPGRKKRDTAWQKRFRQFCQLIEKGCSPAEIMGELSFSRTTYYHYLQAYKESAEAKSKETGSAQ